MYDLVHLNTVVLVWLQADLVHIDISPQQPTSIVQV